MHAYRKSLRVADERELKSRPRLLLLFLRARTLEALAGSWMLAIGIGVGVAGTWFFFHTLLPDPKATIDILLTCGLTVIAFATLFPFFGGWFLFEVVTDPMLWYLLSPSSVDFARGQIVHSQYLPGDRRSLDKMRIRVEATTDAGEPLFFTQDMHAVGWPFARRGENARLKPGDDWYEERGRRTELPIPVWVLFHKRRPTRAVVCGIPKQAPARRRRRAAGV